MKIVNILLPIMNGSMIILPGLFKTNMANIHGHHIISNFVEVLILDREWYYAVHSNHDIMLLLNQQST